MRDIRQKEAAEKWCTSNRKSILYCCPRFGKIRTSILIFEKLNYKNILVCYPNTPIKTSWEEDIVLWKYKGNIKYSTFLSLKNEDLSNYDLIVLDEIHSMSDAQIFYLKNNFPSCDILGLTGTLSDYTEINLKNELGLSVCFRYPIELAIQENVVSDYRIQVFQVPLDNLILNDYSTRKLKILLTEKEKFDKLTKTIDWFESTGKDPFHLRLARMRLIQKSYAKVQKTKQLLSQCDRSLVFCGLTEVADSLGIPVYHSKQKEEKEFLKFCQGEGSHMAVIKLAQAGITIKNLDTVIFNYTDSNEENFIQKLNRAMNYEYTGKIADIKIISTNEQIELKWLKKALLPLEKAKVKGIS